MSIDPNTERMRQETGHDCIMCPIELRNLAATAHNALVRWDAKDWSNLADKMESLRTALAEVQPITDEHFKVLYGWRRP